MTLALWDYYSVKQGLLGYKHCNTCTCQTDKQSGDSVANSSSIYHMDTLHYCGLEQDRTFHHAAQNSVEVKTFISGIFQLAFPDPQETETVQSKTTDKGLKEKILSAFTTKKSEWLSGVMDILTCLAITTIPLIIYMPNLMLHA